MSSAPWASLGHLAPIPGALRPLPTHRRQSPSLSFYTVLSGTGSLRAFPATRNQTLREPVDHLVDVHQRCGDIRAFFSGRTSARSRAFVQPQLVILAEGQSLTGEVSAWI